MPNSNYLVKSAGKVECKLKGTVIGSAEGLSVVVLVP